jgi:site-specific recombinase XerD
MNNDDLRSMEPTSDSALALADPLPLDRHPAAVYLASLTSEHSRRVMAQGLRTLAQILTGNPDFLALNWGLLRYPHTAAVRARLAESYSPATANRLLSALRGVLKETWRLGYMSAEDYHRAVDIRNIKDETLPAGRELSQGEILALVQRCKADPSPAGVRGAAVIGLLYTCGLRRAELVALEVEDFDTATGKIVVRSDKGRKQRTVYAQGGALKALLTWLERSEIMAGPLFVPISKSGKLERRRMNAQSVYDMLKKRAGEAGGSEFSPHDLRRTFVGELLDKGGDIATIAKLAGHADVKTTVRYDRRPEATNRGTAGLLHYPF